MNGKVCIFWDVILYFIYSYILNLINGFILCHETDSIVLWSINAYCRPAGWDNEKKISILYENLTHLKPDANFEEVIQKPITRKVSSS